MAAKLLHIRKDTIESSDFVPDKVSIELLVDTVIKQGAALYRDFAWRQTDDPYAVMVSEVMLQQTQTSRVERYYERWIERFPTCDSLAAASVSDVLELWQGLGYNRRALALKRAAEQVSEDCSGVMPQAIEELLALPGVGPATAAGIMAFAYNLPAAYLETNVRTVFLHELWPDEEGVHDPWVMAAVEIARDIVFERGIDARQWNYALLDYGVFLKKQYPNPSRRSKHHTKQSAFEGSRRQKRARLLKDVLAYPGQEAEAYVVMSGIEIHECSELLNTLTAEGFLACENGAYTIA